MINEDFRIEDAFQGGQENFDKIMSLVNEPHPEVHKYLERCRNAEERNLVLQASAFSIEVLNKLISNDELSEPIQEMKLKLFISKLSDLGFSRSSEKGNQKPFITYDPFAEIQIGSSSQNKNSQIETRLTQLTTKSLYHLIKGCLKYTAKDSNLYPMYFRDDFNSNRAEDYKVYVDAFVYILLQRLVNLCNNNIRENIVNHYITFKDRLLEDIEMRRSDRYTSVTFGEFIEEQVSKTNNELKHLYLKMSGKVSRTNVKVPKDFKKFSLRGTKNFADLYDARDEDAVQMERLLKYLHVLEDK